MSQQQTLLRIETNVPHATISGATKFEYLDTYTDIPIKINKSINEIQDVAKRNSDYSIGLSLPGSKKNNRFFETYYNVDATSLYFNATKRTNCQVLIGSTAYFRGYMRLNKVSVLNSKVEYDVTLYSEVGDLFGQIGNNLLKDLNFNDSEYTFNHTFSYTAVGDKLAGSNFFRDSTYPFTYFYPIVHNGYNYENLSGATLPNFTGSTIDRTRLYTTTSPIGGWSTLSGATAAGVKQYYANSPTEALYDNQFKPALNIYSLIQLIFKTYGYKITSDFFKTPWFKSIYLYGYFSSEATKFSYNLTNIETLPLEGCELIFKDNGDTISAIICKKGTGIPCYCLQDVYGALVWSTPPPAFFDAFVIPAGSSGYTTNDISGKTFSEAASMMQPSNVSYAPSSTLKYSPKAVGESIAYSDGDAINFNLVIDQNIKQIDLLSSIAKKFNLVFIPDENDPTLIKIEPFDFYVGTGNIYDWTPKLSYDKGFTVEPALNYLESQLTLTDLEDGDEGNRIFKNQNNRIYGINYVYNPTDFKSQEKRIETIFSPELIRKWDNNVGLPLGINYAATNEISSADNQVRWLYKGVKSKPKIFYWLMGLNPFIDSVGEVYDAGVYNTYTFKLQNSTGGTAQSYDRIPSISHTMPIGLADQYKINNDSLSLLFNSELPVDIGVQTYDVYTENDIYNIFYNNRITNIYDPNTRMLSGYFDLKYSDIQNLKWNDTIKINEQYFIVNKISEFNLTNREMTKVELLQFNVNPQTYPDRYFRYSYCEDPSTCYVFKTDFTNNNLLHTNFIWSLYYDNQVGSLTGSTSGFTAAFRIYNPTYDWIEWLPYTIQEITKEDYESTTCYSWDLDPQIQYIYTNPNGLQLSLATFWVNTSNTKTGFNVFNSCAEFYETATLYGIRLKYISPITNADGKYITIGALGFYNSTGTYQNNFRYSNNAGQTFIVTSTGNTEEMRILLDGSRIYRTTYNGEVLEYSTNSGTTWSNIAVNSGTNFPSLIATSSSGNTISVVSEDYTNMYIRQSTNSGSTWSTISGSNFVKVSGTSRIEYAFLSCGRTGYPLITSKKTVGTPKPSPGSNVDKLYIQTNSGSTLTQLAGSPSQYYTYATISDDGLIIVASYATYSQGPGYNNFFDFKTNYIISRDGGSSWTTILSFPNMYDDLFSSDSSNGIAMSADGQYIYLLNYCNNNATGYPTVAKIYKSSDYGLTFTASDGPIVGGSQYYVANRINCSQNGKTVLFVALNNAIVISNNYGLDWVPTIYDKFSNRVEKNAINR